MKGAIPVALALLLACAGCAGRAGATLSEVTSAAVPKSTPQPPPPEKQPAPAPPVTGTGSLDHSGSPVSSAPTPPPTAGQAPAPPGEAPPATASTYVYSPQQAVSAPPPPSPSLSPSPSPQGDLPPAQPELPGGELQLLVVASPAEIAAGEIVTLDVMASSSTAVVDAPLHLAFDPNVLEFIDGVPGDFLTQGASSVVFLAEGQSRPGDVAIAAGRVAREQGATGSGLLCRVRFRGVGVGASRILVTQAKAWGTAGEQLAVHSTGTTVGVR